MKKIFTCFGLALALWALAAVPAWSQNCIQGTVFSDLNGNDIQDAGEPGLPMITVTVIDGSGAILQQTTDIDGNYQFCGLAPGQYFLFPELGTPILAATPPNQSVILPPNQTVSGVNFAVADLTQLGVIRGRAFFDANGNGIQDPFEPGLTDAPIVLNGPGGSQTMNTDLNGNFVFDPLAAGDYSLTINASYPNTVWFIGPNLNAPLLPGQVLSNLQFILRPAPGFGSILDLVCLDLDGNGINNPATEPGIGQLTVEALNGQGVVVGSVQTDGNGAYAFYSLPPGQYIIRAVFNPADYTPTTPINYTVDLPANQFRRPGPFYFEPIRRLFECGMALNTFGADGGVTPGVVMTLRDIRNRTGAPMGVNMGWNAPYYTHPQWNSSRMGYVFGLAIDGDFNAYVTSAASGTYWSSPPITSGTPVVFRVNPYTGGVSNFVLASNTPTVVGGNTLFNINSGLGNVTYNINNEVIYVTNRHDQTINVIASVNNGSNTPGTVLQVFDPGFVGQAGPAQGVYGIGYNPVENRLYFARDPSGSVNAEIYSIAINPTNGLITGTETLEFSVRDKPITDIAFAFDGMRMLIAERRGAHTSLVFQYSGSTGAWPPSQPIYVGFGISYTNAAGGVDYAYASFTGNEPLADGCDTDIAATGDALVFGGSSQIAYGFAIIPGAGNAPGSYSNLNSIFIDSDNDMSGQYYVKGLMGDVEVFDCQCPAGCEQLGLTITPSSAVPPDSLHGCCLILDYQNTGSQSVYGIEIETLDGVTIADGYTVAGGLFTPNHNSTSVTITPTGFGPLPNSVGNLINFCLEDVLGMPQYIVINYLDSNYETFCSDTIVSQCMPERACLYIVEDTLVCDTAGYKYIATVANPPGGFAVGLIKFNINEPPTPSGLVFNPSPLEYLLTDTLFPGEQMMIMFTIQTSQDLYGESLCFILSAHDGIEERLCCAEIDTCIAFPLCDPCPYLGADVIPTDSIQADECCFTLLITDTLTVFPNLITGLNVNIITPGITFSGWNTLPALLAGWSYTPPSPTNSFSWTHSSGLVPDGVNYPLFDFCVEGTTNTDSICVVVEWLSGGGGIVPPMVICTDTIKVFCPTCMAVVNDTLRCVTLPDGTQSYAYTFQFENYSPFLVNAVGFVEHPSSSNNVTPDQLFISPVQPYVPGSGIVDISDPITILIDTSAVDTFCLDLVLRQIIGDSIDITCCYVTHCFELPPCDSLENVFCPDPGQISTEPCPQVFDPVCGCDNQTYSNACVADHAGVWIWTSGPCNPDSLVVWGDEIQLQAVEHSGGGVDVSWELRGQGSFDHFFLLRGLPGEALETIELLPATQGRSDYLHLDQRPVFGVNVYQLVGVDQQGRVVYSNVDEVFVQRDQSAAINITAFPIPARNELYIASSKQGPCTIQVIGADGRTFSVQEVNFAGLPVTMDISHLGNGVYFLQLDYGDGEKARHRFVKAE